MTICSQLRDDTSVVTDRTAVAALDDNDIRDMGNVMGGLESTDINKLSSAAISSNLNTMQDRVQGMGSQKAIINRAVSQDRLVSPPLCTTIKM